MRLVVIEGASGEVWILYTDLTWIAHRHETKDKAFILHDGRACGPINDLERDTKIAHPSTTGPTEMRAAAALEWSFSMQPLGGRLETFDGKNRNMMIKLLRQFSTFAGVGVVATAVHYAVLIALVEIAGVSAVGGALAGYATGGVVSYGLNRRHTFRSERRHAEAVWRFAAVAAIGFALTYLFMSLFVEIGGIPYLPAQAVTTGIVMLWGFAAHRAWTFA